MKDASGETGASPAGPSPSQVVSSGGGGDIAVVIRKRPKIMPREADQNDVVRCEPGNVAVYEPRTKLDLTPVIEPSFFSFDHVFDEVTSNEDVYTEVCKPLLQSVREGGGAVIFAFGQTGSGKTYTMLGKHGESPGLYGLAVTELLAMTDSDSLRVSFYEVYGTKLFDLLNDRAELKMLQDESKNIHIMGLTERHVRSVDDIHSLMSQGQQLRAIGTTHANDRSSRSHAVLEIKLKVPTTATSAATRSPSCVAPPAMSRRSVQSSMPPSLPADAEVPCLQGRMTFVDLAGSERASDTAGADVKTRREGAEINKSLLALKECIRAMSMRRKHIPFRGSKLTQILRESFVGLSKTCVIATVSPCQSHCEDTLNTLRYADRIKELKTTASGLRGETPVPCKLCGLPVFTGDQHVCRRQIAQCPHCHTDMDRLELEGHMNECKEAPIRCPHCGERLLRGELARHGRRCLKFPIRCAACGQQVPRNLMGRHTQTECGAAKEKCRYCGNMLLRQGMAAHEQVCDSMKVACTFCLKFVKKKGLERHETTCVMNPNRVKLAPSGSNNNSNAANNTPTSLAPPSARTNQSSESLSRSLSRDLSGGDHAGHIVETTNVLRASVGCEDETNENMVYSPTALDGVYSHVGEGHPRTPDRRLTRQEYDDAPPSPYAASMPTPNRSSQRLSHRSPGLRTEADGLEPLVCPYARYGCPVRVSPFNLSAHLAESVREHLEMVTSYADRVDLENSELRRLVIRDASPSTSRATTPQTVLSKH